MANKNSRSLSERKGLEQNLFEKIAEKAHQNADKTAFKDIAKDFLLDDAVIYGTASFYDFTKEANRKHSLHICNGTACMTAGTQENLEHQIAQHVDKEHIGHASCLGHCHSNHAFMYRDKTYAISDYSQIPDILQSNKTIPTTYHIGCNTTPILTGEIGKIPAFYQLATAFASRPDTVINELKLSKLRGRGGAGFPFWFKLDAVFNESTTQKYIVCNADEGDPGAYSDKYLLEEQPHKVLFGMYLSGLCVGADTGVLYIRGEYPEAIDKMSNAIEFLKNNQLTPNFKWKIIKGQGAYICGEETALLSSIEGVRPEVRVRPPYPTQYGLYGKPTVLSNVETFANIHWIISHGGMAFSRLGTQQSTGTKLVSLDGFFNRPGIYEIEMGTPVNTLFQEYGQDFNIPVKAVQIGGPLGGIVPVSKMDTLTLDFESFDQQGFLLGHAGVVSIPQNFPMIRFLEHLMKFTADESCGKCYPCRIGSYRGYELLVKAQNESYQIDRELFDDLLETLELGSLCALGGGVPLPVKNALHYFNDELQNYFTPKN